MRGCRVWVALADVIGELTLLRLRIYVNVAYYIKSQWEKHDRQSARAHTEHTQGHALGCSGLPSGARKHEAPAHRATRRLRFLWSRLRDLEGLELSDERFGRVPALSGHRGARPQPDRGRRCH